MSELEELKRKGWMSLLQAAVLGTTSILTALTPLVADDFNYAFSWSNGERLHDFMGVVYSVSAHRSFTNGRVFSHGFVQLFTLFPRWVFALCNGLVAAGLVWLLGRYLLRWCGKERPGLVALAVALLWISMPVFGQVFLWADGAPNYGWGLVLALAALWPFYLRYLGQESPGRWWRWLWQIPLAFVAGAWSEHISFSLMAACALLALTTWIRRRKFPPDLVALLLFEGLGYLYLMLAPSMLGGDKGRGRFSLASLGQLLRPVWDALDGLPAGKVLVPALLVLALAALVVLRIRAGRRRTLQIALTAAVALWALAVLGGAALALRRGGGLFGLVSYTPLVVLLALGCWLVPLWLCVRQGVGKDALLLPCLLFLGGLCSLPLFVFAAYLPARGCAATVFFSVLGGTLLAGKLRRGRGTTICAAAVALVFALCLAVGTADLLAVHRSELLRMERIEAARQGDGLALAPAYPARSRYSAQYGLADLDPEGYWPNDEMAKYYGIRQILREDPPESAP